VNAERKLGLAMVPSCLPSYHADRLFGVSRLELQMTKYEVIQALAGKWIRAANNIYVRDRRSRYIVRRWFLSRQ
jgi:hypothetical protein